MLIVRIACNFLGIYLNKLENTLAHMKGSKKYYTQFTSQPHLGHKSSQYFC